MSRQQGINAELAVADYLQAQGLLLLQRNYYSRFGEIDLIMQDRQDNNAIVFVEVRQRGSGFADALLSITPAKQRKLVQTARFFLLKLGHEVNCRFDVVVLDKLHNMQWLKNVITL